MSISNVGGVFVVLFLGGIVSLFMAVCEFVYKTHKDAKSTTEFMEDIKHDLKFCLRLTEYRKPTKKARSENSSTTGGSNTGSKATSKKSVEVRV